MNSAASAQPTEDRADRRTATARRKTRRESLRAVLTEDKKVRAALATQHSSGHAPDRIAIRRTYAQRPTPYSGAVGDRKLPPLAERPPSARLIRPKGIAMQFYLANLFVAQSTTMAGKKPTRSRSVDPWPDDSTGLTCWSDLVVSPLTIRAQARNNRRGRGLHDAIDNRRRQVHGALRTLAGDDLALAYLSRAGETSRPYENYRLLDESGRSDLVTLRPYVVPATGDAVFSVPHEFFTNGWHYALTGSEIAFLMMLWGAVGSREPFGDAMIKIDGETRLRTYGLSPAAYSSHKLLTNLGLLQVQYAEGRDPHDGTFEGFHDGETPLLHMFRILEGGFAKPAVPTVMSTLQTMR